MDLPQGSAVFQHLPGLIGVVMDLDQLFKRYEGVTATAYREAFSRKPLNR